MMWSSDYHKLSCAHYVVTNPVGTPIRFLGKLRNVSERGLGWGESESFRRLNLIEIAKSVSSAMKIKYATLT